MTYLALKYLHLIGSAILFGTGLGIAFFAWFGYRMALRHQDIGLLRGVLTLTVVADTVFTAVWAAIQPVTGALLWHLAGGSWRSPWIAWVAATYVFVGLCWLPVVWLQIQLRDGARAAPSVQALDARFHRQFRIWFLLGWPAFAGVLVLFALMLGRGFFL
ncbi:DUF2269 family protein [Ramlibacter tataouinensis]|uniref:Candidate membrane protein n=1 Tax=Ramlibacter tataouinensis (strain ATCC BAA-407 / DSM 14655 / LMG 21543 / TTB310) TaxID=365046 RepID=F5XWS5_RAMTT|nr:DUF2269 domain-containing protein [Ramlibacter tataouinensis]AEG94219.1 candidate membrane protein [Ramlibacter tataouinensis TTB310]